ncbi:TPA: hypothetical protein ACH3X1_009072 [Trebouxia sp. C0004]
MQGADINSAAGSKKLKKVKAKKHRGSTDAHVSGPDGQPDSGATLALRAQGEDAVSSQEGEAEEDEIEHAEDLVDQRWARARGLLGDSSSEEDEEDAAELAAESDQEEALVGEWGVGAMAANPDEHIPDSDETHRLAIVDLDWDNIRAVDLLAVLRSFLGKGQTIRGVTVYPSDFGLQKMQEEAAVGPQRIFGKTVINGNEDKGVGSRLAANSGSMSDSENGEGHSEAEDAAELDAAVLEAAAELSNDSLDDGAELQEDDEASSSDDSGNEVDQRRLQLYERSRLRYYYAVVDCQDVRTAAHLYAECDGIEFLRSACKLDMRFVPDEQSFLRRQVRDKAEEVPPDYAPPDFTTAALQHTNVKLTWDADDDTRKKALRKKMTEDSIRDDDFKAYLASSSEESAAEEDAAALRDRYRALLLANTKGEDARTGGSKGRTWGGAASGSDQDSDSQAAGDSEGEAEARGKKKRAGKDMDMEVTFTPGLEGLGVRLLAQRKEASQRKGDTVWEAYLRRQKEKKLAAKAQGRRHASSDEDESEDEAGEESEAGSDREQDPFFQHEDNTFDDPFFRDGQGGSEPPPANAKKGKVSQKAAGKAAGKTAGKAATSKAEKAAEQQRQAQLELLMMDDNALQDVARVGGDLAPAVQEADEQISKKGKQKVSRKERLQRKRDQKRAERQAGSDDEDVNQGKGFQPDLQDPRFKSLFTSAEYALDPTDPRFQQIDGSKSIAQKVAMQRKHQVAQEPAVVEAAQSFGHLAQEVKANSVGHLTQEVKTDSFNEHDGAPVAHDSAHLKSMIASLKRKSNKTASKVASGASKSSDARLEKAKKVQRVA